MTTEHKERKERLVELLERVEERLAPLLQAREDLLAALNEPAPAAAPTGTDDELLREVYAAAPPRSTGGPRAAQASATPQPDHHVRKRFVPDPDAEDRLRERRLAADGNGGAAAHSGQAQVVTSFEGPAGALLPEARRIIRGEG